MVTTTMTTTNVYIHLLSGRARDRYDQSLWYAWGRDDAGDKSLSDLPSVHYLGNDFAFAKYAALCAERFETQEAFMLHNIGDQYGEFVTFLALLALVTSRCS